MRSSTKMHFNRFRIFFINVLFFLKNYNFLIIFLS